MEGEALMKSWIELLLLALFSAMIIGAIIMMMRWPA
jgi:hypothetical protein